MSHILLRFTIPFVSGCIAISAHCSDALGAGGTLNESALMPEKHFDVLNNYCLDCHDSITQKGKVNLEELSFEISRDIPTAELWSKVLEMLNSGEMPPEEELQISSGEKTEFLRDLSIQMVAARDILSDNGGIITMRRLNRREYENTLESLLGFRPDVSGLPADDGVGDFDTIGASLFFSSDQFEQYRATAIVALESVLASHKKLEARTHRIEAEKAVGEKYFSAFQQLVANHDRAVAFRAQPKSNQTEESAKAAGFKDLHHVERIITRFPPKYKVLEDYINRPEVATGATIIHMDDNTRSISTPLIDDLAGGRFLLRIRAALYEGSPLRERYLQYAFKPKGKSASRVLGQIKISGSLQKPVTIEIPIDHPFGEKGSYVVSQRDYEARPSRRYIDLTTRRENGIGQLPSIWVDYVEIEGPFYDVWPNPVPAEIVPEREPGEKMSDYARRIISRFATRAFRGKQPDSEFLDKLIARCLSKCDEDEGAFQDAIIDAYALILSSPSFVYLIENRRGEGPSPLSVRELAIRLSYFLWSAPPDDELLAVAKDGALSDPGVLRAQTARLLADPRSNAFISGFTHQWLDMKRLDMFDFSSRFHPEFDEPIRQSARGEIYATMRHLIDEKLPLETLLKANFVMVDDVLADFYGIAGVEGSVFRKVSLPAGSPRGGLLGAAATHIMGSDGQRSSPVERGAWVLRYLLNDPPPPAPANIPMLSRLDGEVLNVRQLQKAHQEEPQCAQCHEKIDPIGYGLENFTAAGLWREKEEVLVPDPDPELDAESAQNYQRPNIREFPIDPSGSLPSGETFRNYFELREGIANHGDAFARGFAEHLIAYALGRPFSITDYNLATDVTQQAATENNSIDAFVDALVQSKNFQSK